MRKRRKSPVTLRMQWRCGYVRVKHYSDLKKWTISQPTNVPKKTSYTRLQIPEAILSGSQTDVVPIETEGNSSGASGSVTPTKSAPVEQDPGNVVRELRDRIKLESITPKKEIKR